MKKKTENSTVNYEQEQVTDEITIQFTRTTKVSGVHIAGIAKKNGSQVGEIYYDGPNAHVVTRITQLTMLTAEELNAVYSALWNGYIEVLNG